MTGSVSHMAKKVLVTFEAEVPAMGYATYYLEQAEPDQNQETSADLRMSVLKMKPESYGQ